jgi:hypothetical protein
MDSLAEQIIVDIISNQLGLDDQNVWVRSQNKKIPPTDGLFVVVGMVDSQVMAVNKTEVPTTIPQPDPDPDIQTLTEKMTVTTRDNIQIDIMSRNLDAMLRRWEILAALASTYSVQKQEENQFKIFRLPTSFVNTSDAEGGSNINRFSLIISCHVWYKKDTLLAQGDIFTEFKTRVDDAKSIETDSGIIEFTIDENTVIEGI